MLKLALTLALTGLAATASAQSTWFVDITGNTPGTGTALDPYTSIDFALDQPTTVSGDLVLVAPGTYVENVSFDGKGVTLMSTDGPRATFIDAGGSGSAVCFLGSDGNTMVLDGFTLTGGTGQQVNGGPGSGGLGGGGVYGAQAVIEIARCRITGNHSEDGGGLFLDDCVTSLRRSVVSHNVGSCAGGGLRSRMGSVDVDRCRFIQNQAYSPNYGLVPSGGGISSSQSLMTVSNSTFRGNTAESSGGGIDGNAQVVDSRFTGNRAFIGGGAAGITATNCVFSRNEAYDGTECSFGGAVAYATLDQCDLTFNRSSGSGGATHYSTLTDCLVDRNTTISCGNYSYGSVQNGMAVNTTISNNLLRASGYGTSFGAGAGDADLVDCDVFANRLKGLVYTGYVYEAGGGGASGGTLVGSRIFGNHSDVGGGGTLGSKLIECEVFRNTADVGAGIFDGDLERTTVYGNMATTLAGGYYAWSTQGGSVKDSILWGNGANQIAQGFAPPVNATYSDIEGGWPGTGNIDADPLFFDAAGDDFHLTARSPCIDAGDPNSTPDPDGSPADMGANPFDPAYTGS